MHSLEHCGHASAIVRTDGTHNGGKKHGLGVGETRIPVQPPSFVSWETLGKWLQTPFSERHTGTVMPHRTAACQTVSPVPGAEKHLIVIIIP